MGAAAATAAVGAAPAPDGLIADVLGDGISARDDPAAVPPDDMASAPSAPLANRGSARTAAGADVAAGDGESPFDDKTGDAPTAIAGVGPNTMLASVTCGELFSISVG